MNDRKLLVVVLILSVVQTVILVKFAQAAVKAQEGVSNPLSIVKSLFGGDR